MCGIGLRCFVPYPVEREEGGDTPVARAKLPSTRITRPYVLHGARKPSHPPMHTCVYVFCGW